MNKKIFSHLFSAVLFTLGLLVIFVAGAKAQGALGGNWARFLPGGLPTFSNSGTGEDLAIQFIRNGVRIVKFIVAGIAVLFGILYAMAFVFAGGKEETIAKQKKNFAFLISAFVLLMVADAIAGIFNPEGSTNERLIDFNAAHDQLRDVANYMKWLIGSVLVLLMTVSGIRLITDQGNEEKITKQKRNLVWSGMGMLVMLLASNIVNAVYVVNQEANSVAPAATETTVQEVAGVIRLILVFLGPLAVLLTIYAGFLYLTALDNEERATKAKTMIVAGVTGIVIIYIAYAITNTLIGAPLVPPPPPPTP